jgi:putative transposase
MNKLEYRTYYERNLPHYQPPGATLFITIRLYNSLPGKIIKQFKEDTERFLRLIQSISDNADYERLIDSENARRFSSWDEILDSAQDGPFWLKNPQIAGIVEESLHYLDQEKYILDAYCIMPNHVHIVFKPLDKENGSQYSISSVMHSIKRFTAYKANEILNRSGQFWQHESYDRVVRDDAEWKRVIWYIVNNPVSAGLVKEAAEWPWTYTRLAMFDDHHS